MKKGLEYGSVDETFESFTEMDFFSRIYDKHKLLQWLLAKHEDRLLNRMEKLTQADSKDNPFAARILVEGLHFLACQISSEEKEKLNIIKEKYWKELETYKSFILGDRQYKQQYYLKLMKWLYELAEILGKGKRRTREAVLPSSKESTPSI